MPTTDYIWEVTTPDSNLHKLKDAESMHYKGTLGTGGDITVLPTASASNKGDAYKVITDGTYAGQEAKTGNLFISNGSAWVLINGSGSSGEDTWRNIKVNGTEKLGTAINTGAVDFVNGTNTSVSFDSSGNKIKVNVTGLGTAAFKDIPSSGNASNSQVVMGNDTRLTDARPASDVSAWAKASTKPTYTKSEVDLGNADNTSDATKKTNFTGSIASGNTGFVTGGDAYTALNGKLNTSLKGTANGVAELDSTGKVPSSQLPSFVDDVIEVDDYNHLPITGESGKIYVAKDTNKTYRWTGTAYAEISESLALGETSSTAYRGDRGKTAYNHATETKLSTATSSGLYKVASTAQGHIASLTAVQKADITALGIPAQDTTYNDATQSVHGLMSTTDKTKLDGISANAKKVASSNTNGHIEIDDVDVTVYDNTQVQNDIDDIQDVITTDTTSASGNPLSIVGLKSTQNAINPVITLEPIQDLHGQNKPYPAKGGKNLMPMTVESLKEANVSSAGASWSGNACTYGTTVFTILTDDGGNVTGIKVTGSAPSSGYVSFKLAFPTYHTLDFYGLVVGQTYFLSGCPSGGALNSNFNLMLNSGNSSNIVDRGNGVIIGVNDTNTYYPEIRVFSEYTIPSAGLLFYPQIELGSSKTSFAPYSNICPISGYDQINILGCGKNIFDGNQTLYENKRWSTADGTLLTANGYKASSIPIPVIENDYNYISVPVFRCYYDKNMTFISSDRTGDLIAITPTNAVWMHISQDSRWSSPSTTMVAMSDTAIAYEPYNKITDLSYDLPETVYGGTLDVETGKLTVTKIKKILNGSSSESWIVGSVGTSGKYLHRLTGFTNDIPATERVVCNEFYGIAYLERNFENNNICWLDPDDNYVNVVSSSYIDVISWKNFLSSNPLELCYSVSPTTLQLTPHQIKLLKDYNYISSSGSTISLTYRDGQFATLEELSESGVFDPYYVHTDNNYTTEEKTKLGLIDTLAISLDLTNHAIVVTQNV